MDLTQEEVYKINKLINKLKKVRAHATELVSLYVPNNYDINSVKNQLSQELGLSANIKSKQTRKAVLASIEKTIAELKKYNQTPKNGLIMFVGDVKQEQGKLNTESFVLDKLHVPVNIRMYRTEQFFVVEPLLNMIDVKNTYALISIDKNEAAIAILRGTSINIKAKLRSCVPGKMRAGGQSAPRFQRVRANLTKAWYEEVAIKTNEVLGSLNNLKGIVIGGPAMGKEMLAKNDNLMKKLKDKILAIIDTGYAGVDGIKELINKCDDIFENEEIIREKKLIKSFFERLGKDDKVTYGVKQTIDAIKIGAVDKIIISTSLSEDIINKLIKESDKYKTTVEFVSDETEEGQQLKMIGGVGAFLRYNIE